MPAQRFLAVSILLGSLAGCQAKAVAGPGVADPEPTAMLDALVIENERTVVSYGGCPYEGEPPPIESFAGSEMPEFRADRDRTSNYLMGDERLDDTVLNQAMQPFQAEVFRCLDIASCYVDAELVGDLDVQLEVAADGRVRAASVNASSALAVEPVIPCARAALARLEFPSIDGGNTFVSYSLRIE